MGVSIIQSVRTCMDKLHGLRHAANRYKISKTIYYRVEFMKITENDIKNSYEIYYKTNKVYRVHRGNIFKRFWLKLIDRITNNYLTKR